MTDNIYRFPSLFAVGTFCQLGQWILNLHIKCPFFIRKQAYLTNFDLWIREFTDKKSFYYNYLKLRFKTFEIKFNNKVNFFKDFQKNTNINTTNLKNQHFHHVFRKDCGLFTLATPVHFGHKPIFSIVPIKCCSQDQKGSKNDCKKSNSVWRVTIFGIHGRFSILSNSTLLNLTFSNLTFQSSTLSLNLNKTSADSLNWKMTWLFSPKLFTNWRMLCVVNGATTNATTCIHNY